MTGPEPAVALTERMQTACVDDPPDDAVARFIVDGVTFSLDLSGLPPSYQQSYRTIADRAEMYEPVMTRCFAKLLQQMAEPRFMDLGAHAGWYSIYAATLLGEQAEPIYSLDGNPAYCQQIRRSCELNGVKNVKVYEAILSNSMEPAAMDGSSALVGAADEESGPFGTAITLDQLCERESIPLPNIVKMDIHGSEGKVLFGMTSVLRKLDYLLLELHGHDRLEELSGGTGRAEIMDLLWDLDLAVYYIAGHTAHPKHWSRECIRSGQFAYRRVTRRNADLLFFDRLWFQFLLVTRQDDIEGVLGKTSNDPFWCY
jgi:FkbM family methyltransferase